MQVMILCGGMGTRLREETEVRPKPMVEIGGRPILWHIMKRYAVARLQRLRPVPRLQGRVDQGVLPQLRGDEQRLHGRARRGAIDRVPRRATAKTDWRVTSSTPGSTTMTGGRVKRALAATSTGDRFMLTYGDGVADVDIRGAARVPRAHGTLATVTAVRPPLAVRRAARRRRSRRAVQREAADRTKG